MSTAETVEPPQAETPATSAADFLDFWIKLCNDFRHRRRREIIEREPSSQKLAQYREDLKWMMRTARSLLIVASDPEFPARQKYAPEIAGKLLQLESYWESLNNPMTDAEADALIQKHFPDEPGAGSPA